MANPTMEPPKTEQDGGASQGHHTVYGHQLGQPEKLKKNNPFTSLVQSFRDVFFPEKLPPLVLESKPIAVDNPMDIKRDPKSTAVAVAVHARIFLLIIWISSRVITVVQATKPKVENIPFDVPAPQ